MFNTLTTQRRALFRLKYHIISILSAYEGNDRIVIAYMQAVTVSLLGNGGTFGDRGEGEGSWSSFNWTKLNTRNDFFFQILISSADGLLLP